MIKKKSSSLRIAAHSKNLAQIYFEIRGNNSPKLFTQFRGNVAE